MITIGNRKIILSETLLCPFDESIGLEVSVPGEIEPWKLKISFSNDIERKDSNDLKDPKATLSWEVEDEVWLLKFANWTQPLGATISAPTEIAISTQGGPITLLAEVASLSALYRINLQLMIEESEND